ncbi:RES family NAD+ phosphorylase [Portibacter lacus]|uniref:RES domain-containing protein n=1 Tax=Portibacter lacus TaxID=1099794 RepID=A0AA37WE19_9BACT|nr:RES family NAD+ phosphorylase [Portibacter lacus]GLR16184.1 hypothetical protein GCM10007940_07990 [Portibacter lacus]
MIVYRLSKAKYADTLSGIGAERFGGRWNSRGTSMIYTSSSRALCTVEIAVHTPLGNIPDDYYLISIEIPDLSFEKLDLGKLSKTWDRAPHGHETQKIGDQFVTEGKSLALMVPAAVVQGEYNYIINPRHPDFKKVKIIGKELFKFDKRLFK